MRWYQQGDVLIQPTKGIPSEAIPEPETILAQGEATGHAHRALGKGLMVYRHVTAEGDTARFLAAPKGATIIHEEHKPVSVPPGTYLIRIVKEYDHFAEEARPVID